MSARPEADPQLGRTLGGQYRIEALLGAGGMGRVYRGRQLSVNRPVAIKLIAGQAPYPPEWVRRFRREAEATASLSHPNSVRLFDFGVTESEELFMVMELLEGCDLARQLQAHGPLPQAAALAIARQVLLALCEAHALGITHRDIKPDNIFLASVRGGDVVAKVMDFGIAGIAQAQRRSRLTHAGMIIGTPMYMSPEQAQGLRADGKSDVYSLGAVLFEMLTGRPIFDSETAVTLLLAHVARAPMRLEEAGVQLHEHSSLQALLDRMLAKDPDDRPTAARALDDITAICTRLGVAGATASMRATPLAPPASNQHPPDSQPSAAVDEPPKRKRKRSPLNTAAAGVPAHSKNLPPNPARPRSATPPTDRAPSTPHSARPRSATPHTDVAQPSPSSAPARGATPSDGAHGSQVSALSSALPRSDGERGSQSSARARSASSHAGGAHGSQSSALSSALPRSDGERGSQSSARARSASLRTGIQVEAAAWGARTALTDLGTGARAVPAAEDALVTPREQTFQRAHAPRGPTGAQLLLVLGTAGVLLSAAGALALRWVPAIVDEVAPLVADDAPPVPTPDVAFQQAKLPHVEPRAAPGKPKRKNESSDPPPRRNPERDPTRIESQTRASSENTHAKRSNTAERDSSQASEARSARPEAAPAADTLSLAANDAARNAAPHAPSTTDRGSDELAAVEAGGAREDRALYAPVIRERGADELAALQAEAAREDPALYAPVIREREADELAALQAEAAREDRALYAPVIREREADELAALQAEGARGDPALYAPVIRERGADELAALQAGGAREDRALYAPVIRERGADELAALQAEGARGDRALYGPAVIDDSRKLGARAQTSDEMGLVASPGHAARSDAPAPTEHAARPLGSGRVEYESPDAPAPEVSGGLDVARVLEMGREPASGDPRKASSTDRERAAELANEHPPSADAYGTQDRLPPSAAETSRSAARRIDAIEEDEVADIALDDDERAHVAKHYGLRAFGRAIARALGRVLIPYPSRERRAALASMPLMYTSFREARAAYKHREINATGFQEAVWQLRERRRRKIASERDRYARGELTQRQYQAHVDQIWNQFWGQR